MRSLPRFDVGDYVAVSAPFLIPGRTKPGEGRVEACGYVELLSCSLNPIEGITYWVRLVANPGQPACMLPCKAHELTKLMSAPKKLDPMEPASYREPGEPRTFSIPCGTYVDFQTSIAIDGLKREGNFTRGSGIVVMHNKVGNPEFDYFVMPDGAPDKKVPMRESELIVTPGTESIDVNTLSKLLTERMAGESLFEVAQRLLQTHSQPAPGQRYEHYKGGKYEIVAVSIHEQTLEPLVTYRSLKKGNVVTRTRKNFLEMVKRPGMGGTVGRPRFMRTFDEPKPKPKGRYAVLNLSQMPLKFTFWHVDYSAASKEAERLAKLNPGVPFSVLSEYATVTAEVAPVKWESHTPKLDSEEPEPDDMEDFFHTSDDSADLDL